MTLGHQDTNRLQPSAPSTPSSPLQLLVAKILQVITIHLNVVEYNEYLQSQFLVDFKFIQGKMEFLKAQLEAKLCHPIGNIFVIVMHGNNLSFKRKLDFIDCMKK